MRQHRLRQGHKRFNNAVTESQLYARNQFRNRSGQLAAICFRVAEGNLRGLEEFNELIKYMPQETREHLEQQMRSSKGTGAARRALIKAGQAPEIL